MQWALNKWQIYTENISLMEAPNRAFCLFLLSNRILSGVGSLREPKLLFLWSGCSQLLISKTHLIFFSFTLKNKDILLKSQEMRDRKGTSQRAMICNDPSTGINSTVAKNNETSILRTY